MDKCHNCNGKGQRTIDGGPEAGTLHVSCGACGGKGVSQFPTEGEWIEAHIDDLITDFLFDNKEFARMNKEAYKEAKREAEE